MTMGARMFSGDVSTCVPDCRDTVTDSVAGTRGKTLACATASDREQGKELEQLDPLPVAEAKNTCCPKLTDTSSSSIGDMAAL